jgi:hypothetical protein
MFLGIEIRSFALTIARQKAMQAAEYRHVMGMLGGQFLVCFQVFSGMESPH